MPTNQKNFSWILAVVFVVLILFGGYTLWRSTTFHVVNTNPSLSSVPSVIPYIDINFNKKLSSGGLSVSADPNIVKSYSVKDKTIRVNLMVMTANESYKLTVNTVKSTDGKIFNRVFTFKARNIEFSKLPESQQQAIVNSQDPNDPSLVTNNPLLAHLPYGDIGYNITSLITTQSNKPKIIIKISVILAGVDYKLSPQALQQTIDQREQAAIDYIKSLGLNPSNYDIQYDVPPH